MDHCKSWISQPFDGHIVIASYLCFLVAIGSGYFYMFPVYRPAVRDYEIPLSAVPGGECNVFDGIWVPDDSYPLYNASDCPFAEKSFNCISNGRKDQEYLRWRWKPKNCDIPRFNVRVVLENLRGKRIVFIGDSLSRTQFESMICMLMTGVKDKRSVYEINGNKITKQIRYLSFRFDSHNLTLEFYRSVFLVQPDSVPKHAPTRLKSSLKLDQLDDISTEWIHSDLLIFNSGHWWTPVKLFNIRGSRRVYAIMSKLVRAWGTEDRWLENKSCFGWSNIRGCYFQVGGRMKLGMPITAAFKIAMSTWASWLQNMINTNRTKVFFRTFESTHWSRGRQSCKVTHWPLSKTEGKDRNKFSDTIMELVKNMTVPVTLLHVTPMGAFRSDAHVGRWSDNPSVPDCSHWCLPGVPDVWNELLFYISQLT